MFRKPFIFVVCWVIAVAAVRTDAQPSRPRPSGLVEKDRIDIVEAWPFLAKAKKPVDEEFCQALGIEDVQVIEGGEEVDVVEVAKAPPLTTQVLMIDASGSMMSQAGPISRKKGRQAKTAARAYVDRMLEDGRSGSAGSLSSSGDGVTESLMVVTFDDTLRMVIAPAAVSDEPTATEMKARIDSVTAGFQTTLYDSLFRLADYLERPEERAALIVLTDGADSGSLLKAAATVAMVESSNNLTLFPISIGDVPRWHLGFMNRIADVSGGKSYALRNRNPAYLGEILSRRFEEIRERLKSQLYVSYLTRPAGALTSDPEDLEGKTSIRRGIKIRSLDPRCSIPDGGYRSSRTLYLREREDADSGSGPQVELTRPLETGVATIEIPLRDIIVDAGPLLYSIKSIRKGIGLERAVELVASPLRPDPGARHRLRDAVRRDPVDIVYGWMVDGLVPEDGGPMPRVMNGTTFLDRRPVLAAAIFDHLEPHRNWALAKFERRVRERYARRVPPPDDPDERARYEATLELIIRMELDAIATRDYQNDLVTWLSDVPARELAGRLMVKGANLLLEGAEGARQGALQIHQRWKALHDWLYFPEHVRVLALLELSCEVERNLCGFHRITRPRVSDLPEDRDQPFGKTLNPPDFAGYAVYYSAKVPRHPFALMLAEWLTDPARGELAAGLRSGWRLTGVDQIPEEVPPPTRKQWRDDVPDPAFCRRRIELNLTPIDGRHPADVRLSVRAEGHVDPDHAGVPPKAERERDDVLDWCEAASFVEFVPRCYRAEHGVVPDSLASLLEGAGLAVCGAIDDAATATR